MYVQQMYLYRWYQDCFIEFHCLSIINFIFILVRRVLCDRFYPSRSRTVSQIVSYIHFLRSKYPWIEPFRRSKPGPIFSFARAITNIICIQYNVYIYIIADVIVYYKERKIEKKKERKYIAVKKKEKKKKNSAVCSSIVKRTKTLIFLEFERIIDIEERWMRIRRKMYR